MESAEPVGRRSEGAGFQTKLIKIADRSEFGWAMVRHYQSDQWRWIPTMKGLQYGRKGG